MSTQVLYSCPDSFYDAFERKGGDTTSTHYCPGCGHGNVHKFIAEAITDFGVQDKTVLVSPVGCSVFAYYYFDVGNVQVAHGRCPAAATALKRANPGSVVLGYQGDGDLAAIGGNEILHAANRGENITIFFINNAIYGMTGGQMAPTTLMGMKTTTTPRGRVAENEGFPIRVCELLNALDAPYYLERTAVGDAKHNRKTRAAVRKAIQYQIDNKGFSLVEILSPCPTGWKVSPVDAAELTLEQLTAVFPPGVYRDGHDRELGHPRKRSQVALEDMPELLDIDSGTIELDLPDHGRAIEEARFKIAGFGGQGVLLLGAVMAQAGMLAKRQVSWLPSYGPEMRGGTANCGVTIADQEIGSPLIEHPTSLVALNGPSLEKFSGDVVPGGSVYYNSSLIDKEPARDDIKKIPVPANEVADRLKQPRVANMVVLGAILANETVLSKEAVFAALETAVKSRPELLEINKKAIEAGMDAVVTV